MRSITATLLASAAATVLTTVTPDRAEALTLLGVCILRPCEPTIDPDIIDPLLYDLQFTVEGGEDEDAIENASALFQSRDEAVAGSASLLARAKGDYRRILAALYNEGRYGPTVSITINGQQAADIPAGTQFSGTPNVVVRVGPGPQYVFGETTIANRAPPAAERGDRVDDPAEEGFAPGELAKATTVRLAGELAVREWREQGYPKAEVADQHAGAVHPRDVLNVRIRMDPGPYATFGETDVVGTERMDPGFVAYMADIPEGAEFDPDALRRARARLDRLGVFSTRRVVEGDVGPNGAMPIGIIVQERPLRRFGVGITASTLDGIGAETFWLHRNLFGRAESLRLEAQVGGLGTGIGSTDGGIDYGLGATFRRPGLFTPDTDLVLNAYARREVNETFTETSYGGSAIIENYLTDRTTLRYGVLFRQGRFDDAFGERTFTQLNGLVDVTYDGRDNKVDATEGFYLELEASPFYEFNFENGGAKLEAEARAFEDFGTDGRSVVALRARLGSLLSPPIMETAPDTLFLTGGGGSVRGFAYKSIGVDDFMGLNETVGGRSLFEASAEFRQRFGESFGAVAFADVGTVSPETFVSFDDVKVGVGLGLRYYTGLGPIRVDVAVPLNPGPDDGSFAIYAGIGQTF